MHRFFDQNETIILFAHGLVFFSLGFAVWIQRRRASRLVLTNALIWLAAFACIEAFAVWGQVFVPIQQEYLGDEIVDALIVLRGGPDRMLALSHDRAVDLTAVDLGLSGPQRRAAVRRRVPFVAPSAD